MNFAPAPLPPSCDACGARIDYEPEDPTGIACNDCWQESELKAQAEAVREFRWAARNWLRCDGCKGTGERRDEHCYCRLGQAMHAAEAKRFEFVRGLPALAVTSPRALRESELDPQLRIAQ
jgi:hypothetical protein